MQNLMRYLHQWTPVATVGSFGRIPQEPEVTKLQKSKQHSADWMHANMYICELCVVAMGAWLRKRLVQKMLCARCGATLATPAS
mmetsp:Transcript_20793/g.40170  ORF Transcript_20793/g.40170 Transcript_20793/m.40170 type:complete len:84 (-) Transcript_20793:190-441(-)